MTSELLLKTYFQINVILIASFLLFITLRQLIFSFKIHTRNLFLVRLGQLLILISVLGPIVFNVIPYTQYSPVNLSVKKPVIEIYDQYFGGEPLRPAIQLRSQESNLVAQSETKGIIFHSDTAPLFIVILFVGIACLGVRLFKKLTVIRTIIERSTEIKRIGRVLIVSSDSIGIPFSMYMNRRSWVVLPSIMLTNWNDVRIAIQHEVQHHRQKDTLWAILIEFIIVAFYLNPFVYLWKREICELQEFSCDESLIGRNRVSSHEYGSCLVRVAEAALGNRIMLVGTTCMAAASKSPTYFKSFLRRRIEMLFQYKSSRPNPIMGILIGTFITFATVALAMSTQQSMDNTSQDKINPGKVTVNLDVQKIAEKALNEALKKHKASAGFVIVAEPDTGRVLAVANSTMDKTKPKNWALALRVQPASVIKPLVAAAAIENRVTSPVEKHNCENGSYQFGGRTYKDYKAFSMLTTTDSIVHSSNICGIKIAQKLGAKKLRESLSAFGIGPHGTAEKFPQARSGILPKLTDNAESDFVGMVGGVYVTPLEIVQAYSAIANGGNLLYPVTATSPAASKKVIRRILSENNSEKVRSILQDVTLRGTGKRATSKIYTTAGKTGSAFNEDDKPSVASFVGFAPVTKPKVVVYVGIQSPMDMGGKVHGSYHAAPVFKQVVEKTLKHLNVPPDKS